MDDWFTIEKIDEDTYAISEYKHWEETHCYLVCGTKMAVLIDTGLGIENIAEVVKKLTNLPILVITTHVHWDHIGGHRYFTNIAVHEMEIEWLSNRFPLPLQVVKSNLTKYPCHFPKTFKLEEYTIYQGYPQHTIHDNECLDLGNRQLIVIHTPGHSPGHCCFYEPTRKYLYSGDLIYCGCLDVFYPTTNPVLFFESIKKIQTLKINRILPGHHQLNVPLDLIGRIEKAFKQLEKEGTLNQGVGIFNFNDFQIHL